MILNKNLRENTRGFSLIELSIVVLILSIILSSALNVLGSKTQAEKSEVTYKKLEKIAKAVKVFAQNSDNNRLPCPMTTGMTSASDNFAEESADNIVTPADCVSLLESGENVMGFVPVLTLGLPPEYMYDDWGRLITYIINKNLISDMDDDSKISNINIISVDGNDNENTQMLRYANPTEVGVSVPDCTNPSTPIIPTSTSDLIPVCASFVLISHGANGHGSRNLAGIELTVSTAGYYEKAHSPVALDAGATDVISIYNMPPNNSTANDPGLGESIYFDDIILFLSKNSTLNVND